MFTKIKCLVASLLLVASAASVYAVCNQSSASTADANLWSTHGCWRDFYLWSYQAHDQRQSDWNNRGWNDSCNVNFEWPKHWNAAYLVTYGLLDNNSQSFHGTVDYRATSEAASSNFHSSLYHTASDDSCCFGAFQYHVFGANEVQTMDGAMVRAVVTAADQREVAPWVTVTTFTFTASARTPSARSIKPTAPPIDSTRRIRFRWNIYAMWRINRRVGCPRACGSLAKLMPISGRFNASSTVPATSAVTRAPGKNWKTI